MNLEKYNTQTIRYFAALFLAMGFLGFLALGSLGSSTGNFVDLDPTQWEELVENLIAILTTMVGYLIARGVRFLIEK